MCISKKHRLQLSLPMVFLLFGAFAPAQDQPAAPASKAPPVERFVFVPYNKETGPKLDLKQSVLLPYAEFLRLKNAGEGKTDGEDFKPLASIAQSRYEGAVENGVARFDAEFVIEALARPEHRLEIRLPFSGAAIESATVAEGGNASLGTLENESGLALHLKGEGRRVLKLRLVAPLQTDAAVRRLDCHVPRAASSALVLRVEGEVALEPLSGALPASVSRGADGKSEIRAACGSRDRLLLAWRPRVEAAIEAARTRFAVEEDIQIALSSRSARAGIAASVQMLAGSMESFVIELPPAASLLSVTGSFVKDWSVGADRRCAVQLIRPLSESFSLRLDVQFDSIPETESAETRFSVPEFRAPGAVRETGRVVITPDSGLSVWPEEVSGLEAISAPGGGAARAYRFTQPGWRLTLSRRPTPSRIQSDSLILYEVTEEFVRLKTRHALSVSGRGIFGITFQVPEGYELREAGPPNLVSGFRQQGREISVNFRGEVNARSEVTLSLQRARSGGDVVLEPVAVQGAEEDAGNVVLAAPLALRATETESAGLEATDVRGLIPRLKSLLTGELEPALGYRYFTPAFRGVASIERRRTRLTCETARLVSVMPSLMRVDTTLEYNVEFSATDEFHLLAPASAGEDVRFNGADIKEKVRARPSETAPDTLTTWTIRLQRRVIGPYRLSVSFDVPLPRAEPGEALQIEAPVVRAARVARETGFVGVSRGENLEVRVAGDGLEGLEPRDVKELPPSLASAFLGFRFFDPARQKLQLEVVRHELEGVLGALIRRMHIETVLSEQGETRSEVIFEVQNNREPYLELKLPEGVKIWSTFVRGVPVTPTVRGAEGTHLIELAKSETRDQAFRVRMILDEMRPGGAMGRIGGLRFHPPQPVNMPVLRTTWKLLLPRGYQYVWFGGTMRMETGGPRPWIEPTAQTLLDDFPAGVAGGVARPILQPQQVTVPAQYDSAETEAEKRARLQGSALEITISREGQEFVFSNLSGVGDIRVHYWKAKSLLIFQGFVALVVFGWLLFRMATRKSLAPGWTTLIAVFVGASLIGGLWGRIFAAAITASVAAMAVGICFYVVVRLRGTKSS